MIMIIIIVKAVMVVIYYWCCVCLTITIQYMVITLINTSQTIGHNDWRDYKFGKKRLHVAMATSNNRVKQYYNNNYNTH